VDLAFRGELWEWRGPAPYHFVTVPEVESGMIDAVLELVTYGWGMVPVTATIRGTDWTTSLFPKDERYLLPVKDAVRKAERLELGDVLDIELSINT
jgi:hypothetical protein